MVAVTVKWKNERFKVEIEPTQPASIFKSQLYDLTNVLPERQKFIVKGVVLNLKDDAEWSTFGVQEGQKLMMIKTADKILKAPEKNSVFVEDSPIVERVASVGYSAGLFNVENNSFWNSTMQCLHSVPELKSALMKFTFSGSGVDEDPHLLAYAMRSLFSDLEKNVEPVTPENSLMIFLRMNPDFNQTHYVDLTEQSAVFCWRTVLKKLAEQLRSQSSSEGIDIVNDLFRCEFVSRVRCACCNKEKCYSENDMYLCCCVEEVNTIEDGLKKDLCFKYEGFCSCSGNVELQQQIKTLNSLPRYLAVYMLRFEGRMKRKLQKVVCSTKLNIIDLCSENLRQKLTPHQGLYDLVAVLTHKGESMEMGHYKAWIKQDSGIWIEYDDDIVTIKQEEHLAQLSGGGNDVYRETAYMCIYKVHFAPM